jgi:NADPH-dependent 2,4-dienoyl-CoA reductase/sulfur reductase-like enzyme
VIVIIGAGPAGLAAAKFLAQRKIRVTIVDSQSRAGGQYWRHHRDENGVHPFEELSSHPYIDWKLETAVWQIEKSNNGSFHIHILCKGVTEILVAQQILLATGAYDRTLPFQGWTTPGVMTQGAVQALAKEHRVIAGKRIVLAGSGPFTYPVAQSLLKLISKDSSESKPEIVGIYEARSMWRMWPIALAMALNPLKIGEALGYLKLLKQSGVEMQRKKVVTVAHRNNEGELQGVTVSAIDANYVIVPGSDEYIACDIAAISYGFTPDMTLAGIIGLERKLVKSDAVVAVNAKQETSVANVWAAGEVTGVGGHDLAITEGLLAAMNIARTHNVKSNLIHRLIVLKRRLRQRIFAAATLKVFSVPGQWLSWNDNSTIICRCEEVTLGEISHSFQALGADSARTAKLFTRAGMGLCQGRVCHRNVRDIAALFSHEKSASTTDNNRPIGAVITLGELSE